MDEYQVYSEIVRENIDMDSLIQRYPYEQKDVQEIYDLIVETVVGKRGKYDYLRTTVSERIGEG